MSYTTSRKSYPPQKDTSTKAVDDGKKKTLLQDNSWIKKDVKDDKAVDQDTNFGRTVLSRYRSSESLNSSPDKSSTTITTTRSSQKSSVQALTRRFSASQDELDSSSKSTTYTKRTSSVKSDTPTITTETKTTLIEEPKTSTTVKTSKDGTVTTVTSTRTSVVKSPTKSETFTEKIFSDVKTVSNGKTENQPPAETKETPAKSSSVSKTEIITTSVTPSKETIAQDDNKTVKSVTTPTSPTIKTTTSTKTYTSNGDIPTSKTTSYSVQSKSSVEDQLFDVLVPTSIKSTNSAPDPVSDDKSSETSLAKFTRTSYKETRPNDYSSTVVTTSKTSSPTRYERQGLNGSTTTYTTTTYTENRPEDYLSDSFSSRTVRTVYTTPERKISEWDICTYCRKPMLSDVKMLLEDADIQCHASCFKCEVCNSSLGHLKAGDSMWIYRRAVHCDSCMGVARDKWRH